MTLPPRLCAYFAIANHVLLPLSNIGHSWYVPLLPVHNDNLPLKLLVLSTQANSSSTGITEAFKADSFEKKINLGSQSLLQPVLASPAIPQSHC